MYNIQFFSHYHGYFPPQEQQRAPLSVPSPEKHRLHHTRAELSSIVSMTSKIEGRSAFKTLSDPILSRKAGQVKF
jgi:hypothetical protein